MIEPALIDLYRAMLRSRLFEEAVSALWDEGVISGEMHLGIGEEAIIAGTVSQLVDGDAMTLDHRGTATMIVREVNPDALMLEILGHPDGLCAGMGGHMHLFSPELLAASSGIVGSFGPAAVGFSLAGERLRPNSVTLAFFGDGAINEGMMMEAFNMSVIWRLPIPFICKDNGWSITTPSSKVTAGDIIQRARGFQIAAVEVDGAEVLDVWHAAAEAIERARRGMGPTLIRATCRHLRGHFSGYQLLRLTRNPLDEMAAVKQFANSFLQPIGGPWRERFHAIRSFLEVLRGSHAESKAVTDDPLRRCRSKLVGQGVELEMLESSVVDEIHQVLERTLK